MTEGPSTNHTNKPEYVLTDKGAPSCSSGSAITEKSLCTEACSELGIVHISNLRDGNQCYKAGNGKCRQDGNEGKGARLVCMNEEDTGIYYKIFYLTCHCLYESTEIFVILFLFAVLIIGCVDQGPWCSELEIEEDCCSTLIQRKCPVKCEKCPGRMVVPHSIDNYNSI